MRSAQPKVLLLLGADEGTVSKADLPKDAFIVYIGKQWHTNSQEIAVSSRRKWYFHILWPQVKLEINIK